MRPRHAHDPYWMMAPTALLLFLFFFYPLGFAAYQSLFEWDLLTPPRYVGLEHYRILFESGDVTRALLTTLTFSVVVVTGAMSLGLSLALALNRPGWLPALVRAAIFSAYVVSWVSVALLWLWVLDAEAGAFTALVRAVGLPTADWLGNPDVALYTVAGVTIWKIAGYSMVLFIAGLQDIPQSLYEAAALDGRIRGIGAPAGLAGPHDDEVSVRVDPDHGAIVAVPPLSRIDEGVDLELGAQSAAARIVALALDGRRRVIAARAPEALPHDHEGPVPFGRNGGAPLVAGRVGVDLELPS